MKLRSARAAATIDALCAVQDALRGWIYSQVPGAEDDILGDAHLASVAAVMKRVKIRNREAYASGILKNLVAGEIRARRQARRLFVTDPLIDLIPSTGPNPEEIALLADKVLGRHDDLVNSINGTARRRDRELLAMTYLTLQSKEQICSALLIDSKQYETRLWRAKEQLIITMRKLGN